jgi:NADPH:quinone reductase-like Zn-dependent oxidoreductase
MQAIVYDRYGGPNELALREIPKPAPAAGELVVRVAAAASNPIDWKILHGDLWFLSGRRFPRQIGADFSGTVEAVGAGMTGIRPGDEVLGAIAMVKGDRGSLAEFARVKAGEFVPKPAGVSFLEAAAVSVVGVSALISVDVLGKARAGQRLLVIGASGGLGSCVMQIARARGLHVTAVCSEANRALVEGLGADEVVAYDREDLFARAGRFDIIVDASAAHTFGRCAPLLTERGIFVAAVPGLRVLLDGLRARLFSRKRVRGLVGRVSEAHLRELANLVERGIVHASVGRTFTLAQTREAIELSMTHHARGKLVVTIG